ncbi:interleukin 17-like protein [Octopus sinensis]|uniref:Interleukin 17-like protein n=1 Tax=Octopus sinensis TaxID=2607531 RepID=A0A6P7S458_9MOLL|nr:interleukin 17-like protein [Octopus sinensis]
MNMTKVLIVLISNILIASSASIPSQCKIPSNLQVQYESLSRAAIGNSFFLPSEMAPAGSNQPPQIKGNKTCPTSSGSTATISERSTCPWYLNITHDSTYFPPSRAEVVCHCSDCVDTDSNHQCVMVYTKMTVLKRTGECIDGLYVYKPKVIEVATACVCARKVDFIIERNKDDYES